MPDNSAKKIYVAGHRGLVGSATVRALRNCGYHNIITRTHAELDLTDSSAVARFFARERPDEVYLAAAKVGGIYANNTYPADFIRDNLLIESNVIHQAWAHGVGKLLFLGSSCIYPRLTPQPIKEEYLLSGPLEPTNEPYAVAKIAGIKLCESYNRQHGADFRSVMPTNLYGPGDNYHPQNSHVIPGLIRRFHEAKERGAESVEIWGTGSPRREFLYIDDMAEACLYVMTPDRATWAGQTDLAQNHINVGCGEDLTILELAELIKEVAGFGGSIAQDSSKPDGTPQKCLDTTRLTGLGWKPKVSLREGLKRTYADFLANHASDWKLKTDNR